jgi:hypothetical protein
MKLLLSLLLFSQINGSTTVTLPALASFNVSNVPANSSIIWIIFDSSGSIVPDNQIVSYSNVTDLKNTLSTYYVYFTGSPGKYSLVSISFNGTKLSKTTTIVNLTNNPVPINPVPINPVPINPVPINPVPINPVPINPVPIAWVVGIFSDNTNSIYNSKTIQPLLAPINWASYLITDNVATSTGSTAITNTKWGSAALSTGLPALLLIDTNGDVINSLPMPSSEASIASLAIENNKSNVKTNK